MRNVLSMDTVIPVAIVLAILPILAMIIAAMVDVPIGTLQYFWLAMPITWLGILPVFGGLSLVGRFVFHVSE